MVILNPWVSTIKVWIVFCLEKNFLIKSILTGCALTSFIITTCFNLLPAQGQVIPPRTRTYSGGHLRINKALCM